MIEQLLCKSTSSEVVREVKFLGEVPTADLINGTSLASAIGLTGGTAQHTDSPWLHFVLDGKTLYVAKKPYRSHVSWNHINDAGAVFGTKTVEINELEYKVRLLKSVASGNIYTGSDNYDPVEAYDSEWNRLMYPIHSGNHIDPNNPSSDTGEGLRLGTLAQYTDIDLVVHPNAGDGSYSWCQETRSSNTGSRVFRGRRGVSYLSSVTASNVNSTYGWRPVLELVS